MRYEKISEFWKTATSAIKYEENGLWGLKTIAGQVVLSPKYDHVEICTDFIYAHYDSRHTLFYKNGCTCDSPDDEDDYRFYEKGMIGLKNRDGSLFLSAEYDEIIDWGEECDVVYVRKGKEFHYYNHHQEEILTDVEAIPEDAFPEIPYNLGEDQNRNVLLCVEPIKKKEGNSDCYAYNQWVRLSRIPYKQIRTIFTDCKVANIPVDIIEQFEDKHTYIYSARVCVSTGEFPISECIEKFKTLGCYDASWWFLLKISANNKTKMNPHDLYRAIKHFENMETCIGYSIAVDYDDSLADGEVRAFQVHFFWDDMGAFLYDKFLQKTLPDGTIEEIKNELNRLSPLERRKMVVDAFWWIRRSEIRGWEETKHVLEYLKEEGCYKTTMLLSRTMEINPYRIEKITQDDWRFKREVIEWAINNGGQLNHINKGKTLYEKFIENLDQANESKDDAQEFKESIKNAVEFAQWLISLGAISADEQRKRIEKRLDGLSPQEVINLVASI